MANIIIKVIKFQARKSKQMNMKTFFNISKVIVFIVAALFIYYFTIRDSGGYPYVQSLIDYKYGFVRRGLWGELANYVGSYPFTYEKYMNTFDVLYVALIALVILLFILIEFNPVREAKGRFFYLMLILTSPFFLKSFIWDKGRMDVIGALVITFLALFSMINKPRTTAVLVSILMILTSLLAENILVLYGMPCLFITYASLKKKDVSNLWFILPCVAFCISLAVNFFANPPDIPIVIYANYLASKTTDLISFESIDFLYKVGSDFVRNNYDTSNRITENLIKDGFLGFWLLLILNFGILLVALKDSLPFEKLDLVEKCMLIISFGFFLILLITATDWLRYLGNIVFWLSIICVRYSNIWETNFTYFSTASVFKVLIMYQLLFPSSMGMGVWYPWAARIEFRVDPGVRSKIDVLDLTRLIKKSINTRQ